MSKVIANMSMSLDGVVSHPESGVEHLFGWYFRGDVLVETGHDDFDFKLTETDADLVRDAMTSIGAIVYGRRTCDEANGWNGSHPMGCPVFVVTHNPPRDWPHEDVRFVTEGVPSAIERAKAAAGGRQVAVGSPDIVRQCLDAGLLDEIRIDLVPVLLGQGTRFFGEIARSPIHLGDPEIIPGAGVTHLHYEVKTR
ncbi:dihydrofolate reductase family protein [Bailinhaonella thermotolerans]|uniref:Deaminase n=1 Tax=Bailinhaonella thermotolerans TaxID=1070861 RepID=A0A3A4B8W0_9ACTN|nr:dihydrofolate reductase family protein [Bailinhaonella thermotolerans]RJL30568.1 deaminase [Bailinhaonella thermotolerans]